MTRGVTAPLNGYRAWLDTSIATLKDFLVGDAIGYQGGRYSGIAFTSERLLAEGGIPRVEVSGRITRRHLPFSGTPNYSIRTCRASLGPTEPLRVRTSLVGDYVADGVGALPVPPEQIAIGLQPLHAPLCVYAVMGNHDIWKGPGVVATSFRASGLTVLDHDAIRVQKERCRFGLAGVSDIDWGPRPRPDPIAPIP